MKRNVILYVLAAWCVVAFARHPRPQRLEASTEKADMPNTLYWNSVTGQWNAASWGGTAPAANDTLYVDGRSQKSMIQSVDQTGLYLTRFETTDGFTGDVGEGPSNPLKVAAAVMALRGRGRHYFTPAGFAVPRLIIDTPNTSHEIDLGGAVAVTELEAIRGRARFSNLLVCARLFLGYRNNPILDSIFTAPDGSNFTSIMQYGSTFIYKGSAAAPSELFVMSGGYCQFDGVGGVFIQTGGQCDFGVEKVAGVSFPAVTTAYLLGGSMDATRAVLGQKITTAYISPTFDLQEIGTSLITTRVNIWE